MSNSFSPILNTFSPEYQIRAIEWKKRIKKCAWEVVGLPPHGHAGRVYGLNFWRRQKLLYALNMLGIEACAARNSSDGHKCVQVVGSENVRKVQDILGYTYISPEETLRSLKWKTTVPRGQQKAVERVYAPDLKYASAMDVIDLLKLFEIPATRGRSSTFNCDYVQVGAECASKLRDILEPKPVAAAAGKLPSMPFLVRVFGS